MIREARQLAAILAAGSALILVVALLPSAFGGSVLESWLRLPFRLLCHGIESRAFVINHEAMPLCARCTGIFSGLAVGGVTAIVLAGRFRFDGRVALLFTLPLVVDGVTQAFGLRESFNSLRFVSGIVAASAAIFWALSAIASNERRTQVSNS